MKKTHAIAQTALGEFPVSLEPQTDPNAHSSSQSGQSTQSTFLFQMRGTSKQVQLISYVAARKEWNFLLDHQPFTVIKTADGQFAVKNDQHTVTLVNEHILKLQQHQMKSGGGNAKQTVKAQMPGLIIDIKVKEGEEVKKGQGLLVLEAMKMQNEIKSPQAGVVEKISIKLGDNIKSGDVLVSLKPL